MLRIGQRFAPEVGKILISANSALDRYAEYSLNVVSDRIPNAGPISGLDALAQACTSPWLLTLPVDLIGVSEYLLPSLAARGAQGAYAEDDDGLQPLVALWRVDLLRGATTQALETGDLAIQALQTRLNMTRVRFTGVRFGNLNTPADLQAAGFST